MLKLKQDCTQYLSVLQSQNNVDLTRIIDSLKVNPDECVNSHVPEYLDQQLKQMDVQTATTMQKMVILTCMLNHWDAIFNGKYPEAIVAQFDKTFNRILATCQTDAGWRNKGDDYYYKDLFLVLQLLFPAGAQVVESYSGFGIKQGLNQGWQKSLRFLWLNLCQGGNKGYYQTHTHTPQLSEFHPQGWDNSYLRIAQMLELNPRIKGIFGGSWFYDPQLKDISPQLMYLQQVPLKNGASTFLIGEDKSGNATFSCRNRRKLQQEGKYTPQAYLLIWPRSAVIKWANHYKIKNNMHRVPL